MDTALWCRRVCSLRMLVVDCLYSIILSYEGLGVVCEGCFAFLVLEAYLCGLVREELALVVIGAIMGVDLRSTNGGHQMLGRETMSPNTRAR